MFNPKIASSQCSYAWYNSPDSSGTFTIRSFSDASSRSIFQSIQQPRSSLRKQLDINHPRCAEAFASHEVRKKKKKERLAGWRINWFDCQWSADTPTYFAAPRDTVRWGTARAHVSAANYDLALARIALSWRDARRFAASERASIMLMIRDEDDGMARRRLGMANAVGIRPSTGVSMNENCSEEYIILRRSLRCSAKCKFRTHCHSSAVIS